MDDHLRELGLRYFQKANFQCVTLECVTGDDLCICIHDGLSARECIDSSRCVVKKKRGLYAFLAEYENKTPEILYIGRAVDLRIRLWQYNARSAPYARETELLDAVFNHVETQGAYFGLWIAFEEGFQLELDYKQMEAKLITLIEPMFNIKGIKYL